MARMNTLFVLVGTTGAGKTALSRLVLERVSEIKRIRSCTTRSQRPGESDDAYHWLSREEFEGQIKAGHFVEYDEFGGNLYGRRFSDFDPLKTDHCFADMTEKGVAALQERPDDFRVVCIRIEPVHKTVLERDADRQADDARRQQVPIDVQHVIRNDHGSPDGLERAFKELQAIIYMDVFPEG